MQDNTNLTLFERLYLSTGLRPFEFARKLDWTKQAMNSYLGGGCKQIKSNKPPQRDMPVGKVIEIAAVFGKKIEITITDITKQ